MTKASSIDTLVGHSVGPALGNIRVTGHNANNFDDADSRTILCDAIPGCVMSTINHLMNSNRATQRELDMMRRKHKAQKMSLHELTIEICGLWSMMGTMLVIIANHPGLNPRSPRTCQDPISMYPRGLWYRRRSTANFAAHLVQRFFPELFTDANIRSHYNHKSGGPNRKPPLHPTRKAAIKRYVVRFFQEVSNEEDYKAHCVQTFNEILRRPVRQVRRDVQPLEPLDNLSPGFDRSFFSILTVLPRASMRCTSKPCELLLEETVSPHLRVLSKRDNTLEYVGEVAHTVAQIRKVTVGKTLHTTAENGRCL
ncbi:hypothetical protein DPMN_149061 [Dreissena polymorpha]|uniref:BEN domain-containing protein n=1 Tax=Dreissena polymorpha TaxID=45954 RepID=A0A9D4FF75_DREPO|nr:hypothetical protein DPMN_149061 [Dreissena polymorpha]